MPKRELDYSWQRGKRVLSRTYNQLQLRFSSESETYNHYDTRRDELRPALRRALSSSGSRATHLGKIKANQERSLFLQKLPAELRLLVYQMYFENLEIIFETRRKVPKKAGAGTCQDAQLAKYYYFALCHRLHAPVVYGGTGSRKGLLDLVLSCRQIYAESIEFLYSQHTWIFRNPSGFLSFRKRILPQRFDAITSLSLKFSPRPRSFRGGRSRGWPDKFGSIIHLVEDWEEMIAVISKMPCLVFLEVILTLLPQSIEMKKSIEEMLPHLWTIKNVKTYDVLLNWPEPQEEIQSLRKPGPFRRLGLEDESFPGARTTFLACRCTYCKEGRMLEGEHLVILRKRSETSEQEMLSSWAFERSYTDNHNEHISLFKKLQFQC